MSSLYDAIGGLPALEFAVERFSERVATDPGLAPFLAGMDFQKLKNYLVGFLGQAVGGPFWQTSATMRIEPRHFERVRNHLAGTLREAGMPEAVVAAVIQRVWPVSGVKASKPPRVRRTHRAAGRQARRKPNIRAKATLHA